MKNFEEITKLIDCSEANHVSLLVLKNGEVVYSHAKKASAGSPFLIASITKPITATAVMILVDQGRIHLSDLIIKYLPELHQPGVEYITLFHLLTHTSGLPDHSADTIELRKQNATLASFYESAQSMLLLFKPGTMYGYSSIGYLLLGIILERVSGQILQEFASIHIFQSLGMNDTAYGLGSHTLENIIPIQLEHMEGEHSGLPNETDWNWNSRYWRNLGAPWGGVISTAQDIGRFMSSFLYANTSPILSKESIQFMTKNQLQSIVPHRGVGFSMVTESFGLPLNEKEIFGHNGATGTMTWAHAPSQTVFVLLTSLPFLYSSKTLLKPISRIIFGQQK